MGVYSEVINQTNLSNHPSLTTDDEAEVSSLLFGISGFTAGIVTPEQAQQAIDALSALHRSWELYPDRLAAFIIRHNLTIE